MAFALVAFDIAFGSSFAKKERKKCGKNKITLSPNVCLPAATLTRAYFCLVTTGDYGADSFRVLCSPQGSWRSNRGPKPTRSRITARSSSCVASKAPRQVSEFGVCVRAAAFKFERREEQKKTTLPAEASSWVFNNSHKPSRTAASFSFFLYLNRILQTLSIRGTGFFFDLVQFQHFFVLLRIASCIFQELQSYFIITKFAFFFLTKVTTSHLHLLF